MSTEENKALIIRTFEEKNLDAFGDFIAPDFVLHGVGVKDLEGYKQYVSAVYSAFPDLHFTVHDVMAEDDKVTCRWTGNGTQKGELTGIPPTGKYATWTGISICRIADGKILERWDNFDLWGVYQQLGAVPPLGEDQE
jgi:steroid delta-isomerase-like uncharacterized protein